MELQFTNIIATIACRFSIAACSSVLQTTKSDFNITKRVPDATNVLPMLSF
jgi:hypothetical protein